MLKTFIIKGVLAVLTVQVADWVLEPVRFQTFADIIVVTLLLAIVNTFIRPLLNILAFPINLMTLGLFPLVLNTITVLFISGLVEGFETGGIIWAFAFSLIISVATFIWEMFI